MATLLIVFFAGCTPSGGMIHSIGFIDNAGTRRTCAGALVTTYELGVEDVTGVAANERKGFLGPFPCTDRATETSGEFIDETLRDGVYNISFTANGIVDGTKRRVIEALAPGDLTDVIVHEQSGRVLLETRVDLPEFDVELTFANPESCRSFALALNYPEGTTVDRDKKLSPYGQHLDPSDQGIGFDNTANPCSAAKGVHVIRGVELGLYQLRVRTDDNEYAEQSLIVSANTELEIDLGARQQ